MGDHHGLESVITIGWNAHASSVAALLITSMAMVAGRLRPPAETERPRMRVATPALCVF
jgi:hypothetical protein